MGLIFYRGQLLIRGGQLAMDPACCCGAADGCCALLQNFAEVFADVSETDCTDLENVMTGSPYYPGWIGESTCSDASSFLIQFWCSESDTPNKVIYHCYIALASSAPCAYEREITVEVDCPNLADDPVFDQTFLFDDVPAECNAGDITVRVYRPVL